VTIIDYSSPRPRSNLRLPSMSRIVCQVDAGQFIVQEWLEARERAIAAVCFAVLMLAYLGAVAVFSRDWSVSFVMVFFWLVEAAVMLLVIHQTWRRTLLTVTSAQLLLKFTSPLYRKSHNWEASDVVEVISVLTANAQSEDPLGELRIQISNGQDIRLFTDHRTAQIDELAVAVRQALSGEA
jgi:hypothetical protein